MTRAITKCCDIVNVGIVCEILDRYEDGDWIPYQPGRVFGCTAYEVESLGRDFVGNGCDGSRVGFFAHWEIQILPDDPEEQITERICEGEHA